MPAGTPKRRPGHPQPSRESLSRERVLAAAVALADREGLAAVTMRRLAAGVGVEAMSLYYHLPGKAALFDGLVERVIDEIDAAIAVLPKTRGWQAAVRQRCLASRTVMLRHPWAPDLIASRPGIPSRILLHYEAILATMVEAGFSYQLAHKAMHAIGSMALGFVQELFRAAPGGSDPAADDQQAALPAAALPHLTAMVASEIHANGGETLGWCDSQEEFEFTLDLLLDGLERRRLAAERLDVPAARPTPRRSRRHR